MHSSSYSYHSSDSVFSNTTSTRTSLDSNENFVSVHCGPTLINSCISFGNESVDGHRYGKPGVGLCVSLSGRRPFSAIVNSATSEGEAMFCVVPSFRLEMLQQIAHRVQRDSVICADKLTLARNALQAVS